MIDLCETMPFFASSRTILVENSVSSRINVTNWRIT